MCGGCGCVCVGVVSVPGSGMFVSRDSMYLRVICFVYHSVKKEIQIKCYKFAPPQHQRGYINAGSHQILRKDDG